MWLTEAHHPPSGHIPFWFRFTIALSLINPVRTKMDATLTIIIIMEAVIYTDSMQPVSLHGRRCAVQPPRGFGSGGTTLLAKKGGFRYYDDH